MADEKALYCSFCGKRSDEVSKLIAGPRVFICNECVVLCDEIIAEEPNCGPSPVVLARRQWAMEQALRTSDAQSSIGFAIREADFLLQWLTASRIEARSDATGTGAAEGESLIGAAETPKTPPSHAEAKQPALSPGSTPAHPSDGVGPAE